VVRSIRVAVAGAAVVQSRRCASRTVVRSIRVVVAAVAVVQSCRCASRTVVRPLRVVVVAAAVATVQSCRCAIRTAVPMRWAAAVHERALRSVQRLPIPKGWLPC
jgi:hypothetical protein